MHVEWLFGVALDGRRIRTPARGVLAVPSRALAMAIAGEWDMQKESVEPSSMPMMTLASTAIDQVAADREFVIANILRYLPNDTTCYFAQPAEERLLSRKQHQVWTPLHDVLSSPSHLGVRPSTVLGLTLSPGGLPHPPPLLAVASAIVRALPDLELAALQSVTMEAKSLLVGLGVHRGVLTAEEAVKCGRVEEEFQAEQWGVVEGGHDMDRLNAGIQINSASVFLRLLRMGREDKYRE